MNGMMDVYKAYDEARKLTNAKHLKQTFESDSAFGFIFSNSESDSNNLCILIYKDDPKKSALIPVSPTIAE